MNDEPNLILGRALAAWSNPPKWDRGDCTREDAEVLFAEFISDVCRNWGLTIVRLGVLEEADK